MSELDEVPEEELELGGGCFAAFEGDCAKAERTEAAARATTETGVRRRRKGRDKDRDDTITVRRSPWSLREVEIKAQAKEPTAGY